MAEYDAVYRIVLVGDTNCGKTCFVKQFCESSFNADHSATIGIDFMTRSVEIDGEHLILQVWDTAGQDRYRSITRQYFRRAQGAILLFDLTKRSSFRNLETWFEQVKECAPSNAVIVVVGNKSDLDQNREVTSHEIMLFAATHKVQFHEASAKTAHNIETIFSELARILKKEFAEECLYNQRDRYSRGASLELSESASQNSSGQKSSSCCS